MEEQGMIEKGVFGVDDEGNRIKSIEEWEAEKMAAEAMVPEEEIDFDYTLAELLGVDEDQLSTDDEPVADETIDGIENNPFYV